MSATGSTVTRLPLSRQQHQNGAPLERSRGQSRTVVTIALFLITYCCCYTTMTTAFQASFSSSHATSLRTPVVSNYPILTTPQRHRHRWKLYPVVLSSNKNQWEDEIIISPDLSEYFKQQQPSSISTSSSSSADNVNAVVDTRKSSVTKTATRESSITAPTTPSSLFSADQDNSNIEDDDSSIMDVMGDSNIVTEIVTSLKSTIENGTKGMIPDIMASIQRLQRIQQQHDKYSNENFDDDEKLVLMKNPKKRSTSIKKKKGGLGKATSASLTTTSIPTSQQRSSSSSSRILKRFVSTRKNIVDEDEISYRLLWVGSDDTISAFGTGLHKVPLARLQEVFLSIRTPSNRKSKVSINNRLRLTTTEVIRILGPFPNIKNTLQGTCTVSISPRTLGSVEQNGGEELWDITWDSMIDGTGKELIGKNNDDVRHVPTLRMLYGDEQILVASIQPEEGTAVPVSTTTTTPGPAVESILLFVREMEMEDKLTALRVL